MNLFYDSEYKTKIESQSDDDLSIFGLTY